VSGNWNPWKQSFVAASNGIAHAEALWLCFRFGQGLDESEVDGFAVILIEGDGSRSFSDFGSDFGKRGS
jgi:hypothetical protein